MQLNRITFITGQTSQYSVLNHFSDRLYEAFRECSVEASQLSINAGSRFLKTLHHIQPQCLFTFNAMACLSENPPRYLSDTLHIPYLSYLVDSPQAFYILLQSNYTIETFVDRPSVEFFKRLGGKHVLFMPHAVEESLITKKPHEKKYDVAMLASFLDYEEVGKIWEKKYPKQARDVLWKGIEYAEAHPELPYFLVLEKVLEECGDKPDIQTMRSEIFAALTYEIEFYCRGLERIRMVQAITDVPVHLFFSSEKAKKISRYFKKQKNLIFHDSIPFTEALEVMKATKVLLNSCPWIKDGSHERIFYGLACGALPITSENPFLKESFKDEQSMLFYRPNDWKTLNEKVSIFVKDDNLRNQVVEKGQDIVKSKHTWKCRAQQLLKELPPIIESIHEFEMP